MRTRVGLIVLSVACAVVVSAQQPTFRGGTNYVRVDMYATRNGVAVTDLTRNDVEILEDGVVQKIEAFEHVRVRPAGPQETRREPQSVTESREMAGDPRARVFVIFLDTYHTTGEGSVLIRKPLINFIERVLGDDDLIAVMTPEMAATDIAFGRKTVVITRMLGDEWWGRRGRLADQFEGPEAEYLACYGEEVARELQARRREKITLDALEDLVTHLNGVRDERKAVLAVTDGWLLFQRNERLLQAMGGGLPGIESPRPAPNERNRMTNTMRIQCDADLQALAMLQNDERLREIGEVANRSNVTFYPVFSRGLVVSDEDLATLKNPRQDAANLRVRQDSLRQIAEETDGEAIINTNSQEQILRRIADDMSSYYLLGYYSSNTKLDGRFRSIEVRVKQPGVKVRSRRGYRGMTADSLLTTTAKPADPGAATVATALNAVAGVNARAQFRVRAASWHSAVGGDAPPGAFWLTGEVDGRVRKELLWTAGASAEVTVVAADGRNVMTSTLDVPSVEGNFALRVPESGGVAPGEYAVRVRLQSKADAGATMSDIVRVIVAPEASPLGEPVLWRRGPSTGPRHMRTADPRFTRSERVRLELPASPNGTPATRLLDRTGKPLAVPLQVSERPDASGAFRWIVVDATLAPLATGDYAIEVTLDGAKQVIGFRVSS